MNGTFTSYFHCFQQEYPTNIGKWKKILSERDIFAKTKKTKYVTSRDSYGKRSDESKFL
jgi:hypothetical protein